MLPNVDIRSVYRIYYTEFALFFLCAGLLLKPLVTKRITGFSLGRLMVASIGMNAASYLSLGAAVPAAMFLCLSLNKWVIKPRFGTDYNASFIWLSVVAIVTVTSAVAEALVLRFVFTKKIGLRAFLLLCGANARSMTIALYGIYKYMLAHQPEA